MADLSVNVGDENRRLRDILAGAAIGAAMIAAGLYEAPVCVADTITAQLSPPSDLSVVVDWESVRASDIVYGVTRFVASQNALSAGLVESSFKLREILNPLAASSSESAKVSASGVVTIVGLGNPIRVTDGPPLVFMSGLDLAVAPSESLKVVDSPSTMLNPLETAPAESLKVVDTLSAQTVSGVALTEPVKIAEQLLGPTINPEQAAPTDSAKADDGGFVELIGLGNPIRIADGPVIAQLAGTDISVTVSESLKVADIATTSLNPEQSGLSESLKVVDAFLGTTMDPEQASPAESLKIADVVQVVLGGIGTAISESLKVVDSPVPSINPEQAAPSESLKVVDSVSASIGSGTPLNASISEVLEVSDEGEVELRRDEAVTIFDAVNASINPEQAAPTEALKVVDSVSVSIGSNILSANISESLKVDDDGDGEVELSHDDTIKIADSISAVIGNFLIASPSESLKISDSPSAALSGLMVNLSESFRLNESGEVEQVQFESLSIGEELFAEFAGTLKATPAESLKVVDGPINVASSLLFTSITDGLKVYDTGEAELAQYEDVKVADQVFVNLFDVMGQLFVAVVDETLKVADSVAITLNPERALPSESVKVSDTVTALMGPGGDLTANASESLKVVDTAAAVNQLGVQLSEALSVVDGAPSGRLDPIQASATEALKVADEGPSITTGTTIAVIGSEGLKVGEVLLASIDPVVLQIAEGLRLADVPQAVINPEVAALTEGLKAADSVQASLDTLQVALTESLRVEDDLAIGGPSVIHVVGSYVTSISIVGGA